MQLIDVGMTSMVISESIYLAKLADLIGRTENATSLRVHADSLRLSLSQYNWDNSSLMFTNRRPNSGTFYRRFSPTSFYSMMAKVATDEQAVSMTKKWLLNPHHFAITVAGDHVGNSDANWWGLPSIEQQDAAFPKLGYWRGLVWGPMAQLTWWSLKEYDHLPIVSEFDSDGRNV